MRFFKTGRESQNRAKPLHIGLATLLYLFFAVFLVWPIIQIVAVGFRSKSGGFTLNYVYLIFKDHVLLRGLLNAMLVAGLVALVALLISLPLAVLSVRFEFRGRGLLTGLLLVPLVLPPFVGALGMRLALGRFGPLTHLVPFHGALGIDWRGRLRLVGIVIVEALHFYPLLLLNLQASLANVDPAMEQAAANIGASRWRIFTKIIIPLIRPGLFAGLTLVLISSFTELGTPLMFSYYTITPVQLFHQITDVADNPLPYALVVVMLISSSLLYVIGKLILGRSYEVATTKASIAAGPRRLSGVKGFFAALPFLVIIALALLPHISVLLTSLSSTGAWYKSILPRSFTLGHFKDALVDELAYGSIRRSIQYAALATAVALIVGVAAAIIIVRSDVRGRNLIDALSMLPLAVPGLVLAFGYLAISISFKHTMGERTPAWLDVQKYPAFLLIIAYAARRLPYVVRSAVAGLQQTPKDLELAGANLGASRFTILRRITISLILAQRTDYYPITKAILDISQRLGDGMYVAAALGVWAMALLTLTILSANAFLGKKMGAIFRI